MASPEDGMFRLRVQDGDTQHVYRGVSANTWLTPIGLTVYKPGSLGPRGGQIPVPCAQAVQQRAKSANAILGRRHFEAEQQGLQPHEIITGKSVYNNEQLDEPEEDSCTTTKGNIPPNYILLNRQALARPKTSTGDKLSRARPKTSIDERKQPARPYTSVGERRFGHERADLMECSAFMVRPLQSSATNCNNRCKSAMIPRDTLSFKALKQSLEK